MMESSSCINSSEEPTPQHVYGSISLKVAQVIDRRFFNAIGSTELELIGQEIALKHEDSLLDIGTGNANVSAWLAQKFGIRVVGLEPSDAMIDEARTNIAHAQLQDRIEIFQSDFFTWDQNHDPTETYDTII